MPAGVPPTPPPPGRTIPSHFIPFDIDDGKSTKGEIEAAVRRMRRNRASSNIHVWAEHLQAWMREAYPKETSITAINATQWLKLVELIQLMW